MHEMICTETHPSGAEEWYCPECGRRIVIQRNPWSRVTLTPGNDSVSHSGSRGGVKILGYRLTETQRQGIC
jgi:hypothetical protein